RSAPLPYSPRPARRLARRLPPERLRGLARVRRRRAPNRDLVESRNCTVSGSSLRAACVIVAVPRSRVVAAARAVWLTGRYRPRQTLVEVELQWAQPIEQERR